MHPRTYAVLPGCNVTVPKRVFLEYFAVTQLHHMIAKPLRSTRQSVLNHSFNVPRQLEVDVVLVFWNVHLMDASTSLRL